MSAESSSTPGPAFTQVRLSGPASEVARLVAALNASAEIISDAAKPVKSGGVERVLHLVTHPEPRPVTAQGVSVTVQSVLEANGGAFSHLPDTAAVQEVEQAVAGALQVLPHVRQASSRVVSSWGLPSPRQ